MSFRWLSFSTFTFFTFFVFLLPRMDWPSHGVMYVGYGRGQSSTGTVFLSTEYQLRGCTLQHAGEGMKNDVTIVLAAVQQNGRALVS